MSQPQHYSCLPVPDKIDGISEMQVSQTSKKKSSIFPTTLQHSTKIIIKKTINLCNHNQDYGAEAEWHFSATTHGKRTCNGLGATVKRLAAWANLQRPYKDQIMDAKQLFEWLHQNIFNIDFVLVTLEEYIKIEEQLANWYNTAVPISGIQKLHAYLPLKCGTKLNVKLFSCAIVSNIFPVVKHMQQILVGI